MKRMIQICTGMLVVLTLLLSVSLFTFADTINDTGKDRNNMIFTPTKSGHKYDVGDTVTVAATWNPSAAIYHVYSEIKYNASVMKYVSGAGSCPTPGEAIIDQDMSGETTVSISLKFEIIAEGDSTVSVSFSAGDVDGNKHLGGASATLHGAAASASSSTPAAGNDANLTALKVSSGSLSPAFSANRTSYTVTVENSVTKMTVSASAAAGATVSGAGNISLAVGDNKCTVTVTAADGVTKKTYTITIRRLEEDTASEQPAPADDSDALAVQIDGAGYHLMTDLSPLAVPAGFALSSSSYSGIPVPAYTDDRAEFTLYGLTPDAGGTPDYYTYNAKTNAFEAVKYLNTPDRFFIFLTTDKELSAPEGFYAKTASVGDVLVDGFAYDDSALGDFAVIYCFVNGQYGYYRYDSREGTLQRCPEFRPVKQTVAETPPVERTGVLARLSALSDRAKLVIFALIVAAVCAVALVVLLVIHGLSGRRAADRAFDDEFDYGVDDAIPFQTVEELSDQDGADEADDPSAEPQAQPPEQEEPDEEE